MVMHKVYNIILVGQPASNAAGLIIFIFSPSGFILEEVKPFFPLLFTFLTSHNYWRRHIAFLQKKRRHAVDTSQKKTTNRHTDRHTDRQNSAIIYIEIRNK